MSHTLITVAAVLAASLLDWQWVALLVASSFWLGREHSQAEYRWMAQHKANRSRSPWYMGILPESWTKKSMLNDMLIPIIIGTFTAWVVS